MRYLNLVLLTCCLIAMAPSPCSAVIVLPAGGGKPIKGRLVRMSPEVIVLRVRRPDGSWHERTIDRSGVEDVLVTVSKDRLASLGADRPKDYRDYAEELAEKREDPDARAAAIRLYLIAAYLDPDRLGRSCLLGMTGLARDAEEERKFRAMVYLLDPEHDRRSLRPAADRALDRPSDDPEARDALLKTLRTLRLGRRREALHLAKRPDVTRQLASLADIMTHDELVRAAEGTGKSLSPAMLRKVLTLELALLKDPAAPIEPAPAKGELPRWSQTIGGGAATPLPSLTLETLVGEFDPRKCHYRDGKWVEP